MRIVDMFEIPSEKKIHSSSSGEPNMKCIFFTVHRYCTLRH